MNLIKTTYYKAASLLPMSLAKAMGSFTTLLPYHHTVSNEFLPHIKHLFDYKNVTQFSSDIDFLLKNYIPVTPDEIIKSVNENKTLPKKSFLLTFDDGFREVYDIITPILERKGVPAIFFINPAFIDNNELFYRCKISLLIEELLKHKENAAFVNLFNTVLETKSKSMSETIAALKNINSINAHLVNNISEKIGFSFDDYLKTQKPYLTLEQLKLLHNKGFTIGAHSMNHPYYQDLSLNEQIAQTQDSCAYVNKLLNINDCSFSFPHTDAPVSQEFFNKLSEFNIPLYFGIQNQKLELNNKIIHRFNAERPEVNFASQIKGLSLMIYLQKLMGKNNVTRNVFY